MPLITSPSPLPASEGSSMALLQRIRSQLGPSPGIFLGGGEGSSRLDLHLRTRISFAVASVNGCVYCPSTHVYMGANAPSGEHGELADGVDDGSEGSPEVAAAVRFAVRVAQDRGRVAEEDLRAVRAAGYDDEAVLEIVTHVAVSTLNDYLNRFGEGAWG